MNTIIKPTIKWMNKNGIPFTWILYAGLMITKNWKPKVLEFNTRLGDPEAQPILMKFDSDFVDLLLACTDWTFEEKAEKIIWSSKKAVTVVIASKWYPEKYEKWKKITWLDQELWEGEKIFHK